MNARSVKILIPVLTIPAIIFAYNRVVAEPHIPSDSVRRVALILEASYRMAVPRNERYDVAALTRNRLTVGPMLVDLCEYRPDQVRAGCARFLKAGKHTKFDPPPKFINRDRIVRLMSDVYWRPSRAFDATGNVVRNTFSRHGMGGGVEVDDPMDYWDLPAKNNSRKDPRKYTQNVWPRDKVDSAAVRALSASEFATGWYEFESR